MAQLISNDELPNNGSVYMFEGYQYGDIDVSFSLSDTAPGKGPDLHKHPYERSDHGRLHLPLRLE
jgi:hypothetical protein